MEKIDPENIRKKREPSRNQKIKKFNMEHIHCEYLISEDKSKIDLIEVKRLLSTSYWANDRNDENVKN